MFALVLVSVFQFGQTCTVSRIKGKVAEKQHWNMNNGVHVISFKWKFNYKSFLIPCADWSRSQHHGLKFSFKPWLSDKCRPSSLEKILQRCRNKDNAFKWMDSWVLLKIKSQLFWLNWLGWIIFWAPLHGFARCMFVNDGFFPCSNVYIFATTMYFIFSLLGGIREIH